MTTLSTYPAQILPIVRSTIASRPGFRWLMPSWIMASIQVESSFQPLVVNATGRQDGLMQVIPSTVTQMQTAYALGPLPPQTDPATSILCGVCYLDWTARRLISAWGIPSIPLSAVIEGYNEGEAAAEKGLMVPQYWADWIDAQAVFASDDMPGTLMATISEIRRLP